MSDKLTVEKERHGEATDATIEAVIVAERSSQLPMKAPTIPTIRSPTIPSPVPCTIWPAAIRP